MSTKVVVDASVAIKWFLQEPETSVAKRAARAIAAGSMRAAVPELFYFEVHAVMARRYPDFARWTQDGAAWLTALPLMRVPFSAELARAAQPFVEQGLTGYDATYAALAVTVQATWITYDEKAYRTLGEPTWAVCGSQLEKFLLS